MNQIQAVASIDRMAAKIHESWRTSADRGYSPFNRLWHQLTPEQRQQVSRQTRGVVDELRAMGQPVAFIDEYAQPGPGDVRWDDPQSPRFAVAMKMQDTEPARPPQ